jgi:Tfp pilus assembly protein PilN
MASKKLKPVLTEGQWERVLTAQDIPVLDPDASAAFILWTLGWFAHADADEHKRIAKVLLEGINEFSHKLASIGSSKENRSHQFQLQMSYQNIQRHYRWHTDMAERIDALLPPRGLILKLEKERALNESTGMEKGDPGRAGAVAGSGQG